MIDDHLEDPEGWAWPTNSRKAHYFVEGRSLCRSWAFFGSQVQSQEMGEEPGPDDCRACWRKHEKTLREGD